MGWGCGFTDARRAEGERGCQKARVKPVEDLSFYFFFKLDLIVVGTSVLSCIYVCAPRVFLVPSEARRYQIPWDWTDRQLCLSLVPPHLPGERELSSLATTSLC